MTPPKKTRLALVIPTYNMANHLAPLWESLGSSGLTSVLDEIIFVDDGSTDNTPCLLNNFADQSTKVRIVCLKKNQGRFLARKTGADVAQSDQLLFLDSRITLPADFGEAVQQSISTASNLVGSIDIDTSLNLFCLYWQRTHELIFWRHYRDTEQLLELTTENYDKYLKGTGLFLCNRESFIRACNKFGQTTPLSDDTYLMRVILEDEPIFVTPHLRARWAPRDRLLAFLGRLWERGPQFMEYHFFNHRGFFFWIVVAGFCLLAGMLSLLIIYPKFGLFALLGSICFIGLSTALISRCPREFFQLMPLHMLVVLTCSFSILRGLLYHCLPKNKHRFSRRTTEN